MEYKTYYDYIKFFINDNTEEKEHIVDNLNYFYISDLTAKVEELNDDERNLMKEPYMSNVNLVPTTNIKEIYELLSANKELKDIIEYFYRNKLELPLTNLDYRNISKDAKSIKDYIQKIDNVILDNQITYQLFMKWIRNGASVYDLKIIEDKIKGLEMSQNEKIISSRSSYINFIYGSKLTKFPLDELSFEKENLIIYAISNNKSAFLKLIEDHMQEFLDVPSNSILYNEKFYTTYINLNEMTLKNIVELQTAYCSSRLTRIDEMKEIQYTFKEFMTLYMLPIQYIKLYNEILELKVDERILRIKQFIKKELLSDSITDSEIIQLADKIKEKPLYSWIEKEFRNIIGIKPQDAIKILINYNKISKFINEINNKVELSYILRNVDEIQSYESLLEIKENIEQIDRHWKLLKVAMNFNHEFISKYRDNIKEFLLNNGAELACVYYTNCGNDHQKDSYKLIVKAQLMGEFEKLKYHTDDLNKEINYKLNVNQIEQWTRNTEVLEGKYDVREYDDFYHTMILGELPQKTCLSYSEGMYRRCLLACFDSNKKILYAKKNGKIVARAMIRLTKGKYNAIAEIKGTLSFYDVENKSQIVDTASKEVLTIFLERMYYAEINEQEKNEIVKMFIKLLEDKATKMNALFVCSKDYSVYLPEDYIKTRYYMYISKSKSSSQYLDSLDGQASIVDEGQYKSNNFMIWKPNKISKNIFEESIFKNE